jgi:hypothetical protein
MRLLLPVRIAPVPARSCFGAAVDERTNRLGKSSALSGGTDLMRGSGAFVVSYDVAPQLGRLAAAAARVI